MRYLSLSGYFRLPDDADESDVAGALTALAEYWLGPEPEEIDPTTPVEIPKIPGGDEYKAAWEKFWRLAAAGRRMFIQAGISEVATADGDIPELIE